MRITILFGGTNKERLVSVASAQALHAALPDADLWFWDVDDTVHEASLRGASEAFAAVRGAVQAGHARVGRIEAALDQAKAEDRLLVLGLHGGTAENGELQAMCEMRGIPFTGSGSASSHLAFDKVAAKRFAAIAGVKAPAGVALGRYRGGICRVRQADCQAGPRRFELRTDLRQREAGPRRRPSRRQDRGICDRAVHRGQRGDLRRAGAVGRLADRASAGGDHSGGRRVRLRRPNIWPRRPRRSAPDVLRPKSARKSWISAVRAHRALSCSGYSRSDFIVSDKGPIYLETNTLPGLTKASLYPKALKAQGIEFVDFLRDQIVMAQRRSHK